jgi:hypothetical protein
MDSDMQKLTRRPFLLVPRSSPTTFCFMTISESAKEFINVAGLRAKIKTLEVELSLLKQLDASLGGKKAGRPAKVKKATSAKPTKRGKRGKLGESILKFLSTKGAAGAHVKDIAIAVKSKPLNVTAWFYTTGKGKTKKVKPATFALVPSK